MRFQLSRDQQAALDAMDIPVWLRRESANTVDMPEEILPSTDRVEADVAAPAAVDKLDWRELEHAVHACSACELHAGRSNAVFGVGNQQADWLFVGEAPGAEEDKQGEPFVGRAGQLLNAMLVAMNLSREQVYIANVLKCRPPLNRDPQMAEVEQCEPYLLRQIQLIQPKIIVALGRFAAHSLLRTELAVGRLRNQQHDYHGTPLVVTYHPAYLLRNPADKKKVWDDLCLARSVVQQ
jgi:DNA polymerase